ncbi:macro domain-containing protein [Halalkalibacter alkalisediminis]|uniref:Macro domain-containing protein n=1 Tax=Halalkalibacter alkalisediminis TaxID=935616 RepID=A0ABV6NEY4_9BACI|nr:macro domain-containing protein [Halalkalibacter alkalisediminis]
MKELIAKKKFWQDALPIPSLLFTIATGVLAFFDFAFSDKIFYVLIGISILIVFYCLFHFSGLETITLNLNGSNFEIVSGDIFNQESNDFKVIAFNEYFDTEVDNSLIAETSLNGQYIMKFYSEENDLQKLDEDISTSPRLQANIAEKGVVRPLGGKTTRYELGSIYKDKDFFLVAFSKFNDKNEANLRLTEYATCLLKFWDEVNTLYNQQTVVIPLLGTGITRHKDFDASNQELLEVLIWTFKISKVKFKEPSKIKIVIRGEQKDNINFYSLKEREKNGI